MKSKITFLDWRSSMTEENGVYCMGDDLILLDRRITPSIPNYPFKIDMTTAVIVLNGESRGSINLQQNITHKNTFSIILPDQILTHEYTSYDYEALYIVMSNKFIASLGIHEDFPSFRSIIDNPTISLTDEEMRGVMWFFQMLKHIIISESNKFRYETAKHLTLAFFYGASSMYSNKNKIDNLGKDRHDNLTDEFLNLVKKNYKQQRAMQFYADKLCISPKYLSSIIKSKTGVAANEWIDRHVILEAKALLKSTNMTISQISEYLEFPSQSFFGKYFKRITGISPREYQKHKI